jgi:WD40 repeat protein/transcriptional regulator with XRE-family HTH domain
MQQEDFGEVLKEELDERNYNQGWLARKLKISPSTISKWVSGSNKVPFHIVKRIGELLGLEESERARLFRSAGYELPSFTSITSNRPFIVDELADNYIYRVSEFTALKASVLQQGEQRIAAITSALKGAGGYGKTMLAQAICHDDEIKAAFPDGIEWVTLGEALTVGELVDKMKAVIYRLRQKSLPIESFEVAKAELRAALEDSCLLLILDDVWREPDLKPFLEGGPRCVRLITTRNEAVLPPDVPCLPVDAMSPEEAVQLLYAHLGTQEEFRQQEKAFYTLAQRLKEWPLLLGLANGILRNRVKRHGLTISQSLAHLNHALDKGGLLAFDPHEPGERRKAVALTLDASFALLSRADYRRYLKLAVFPENIAVPFGVIHRLWGTVEELDETDTVEIVLQLYELSLLRFCDLNRRQVQLHDVIAAYLRVVVGDDIAMFQQQFLNTYPVARWADMPTDDAYLWKYLVFHLVDSRQMDLVYSTVTDLGYLAKKIYVQQSVYAAEADIELAEKALFPGANEESPLGTLKSHLARIGDLLHACKTIQEVENTLLIYVYHVKGFSAACQTFQQEIPRPFLLPWHLLPDVKNRILIRTLHGHTRPVTDCAISPDGTWIVSASEEGTLRLWDVHSGALRFILERHAAPVTCCAITPGGNRIISASSDGTIKIWNAYTGSELLSFHGHDNAVTRCEVSPDGAWFVSASQDGTLKLWNISSINTLPPRRGYRVPVIRVLQGHEGAVRGCAISPDGTWIASVSDDRTLRTWNAHTGSPLSVVEVERGEDEGIEAIYGCAIGPDGTWIAFTYDIGLQVWDIYAARERFTTYGHVGIVVGCAISPDGRWMLSASTDGTLKGWRTDADVDIFILKGHADTVNRCVISPNGDRIVSASDDCTLKVWQVPPFSEERLPNEEEYAFGLVSCAFSHSGDWVVTVALNGELKRWDAHQGVQQDTLSLEVGSYAHCAVGPDDTWIVTGSDEKTLKTWGASTGAELRTFIGHTDAINDCAIGPDGGWLVSASGDKLLKIWDVGTGTQLQTLVGHSGAVNGCAISPDGAWIVSASTDHTLKTWNARTGALLNTFSDHLGAIRDCAITSSGDRIASASEDGTVRIWYIGEPLKPAMILQHAVEVRCCAVSPTEPMLVSLAGTQLKLWHLDTGACLATFYSHNTLLDCAFHPDGHHLVVAAENGLSFLRIVQ